MNHEYLKGPVGMESAAPRRFQRPSGRSNLRVVLRVLPLAVTMAMVIASCGRQPSAQHFGDPFTAAPQVTIAQLLDSPDRFRRQPVRVTGAIERQCPSAGCWLFLRDGEGHSIRVELGDYFARLPQNVGKTAEVEGEWIPKGDGHEFIGTRITFRGEGQAP